MSRQFHISQEELLLLTFLHENSRGYGPQFKMAPSKIVAGLNIDHPQLLRCASYLAEHRLIGLNSYDTSGLGDGAEGSFYLSAVYLTGFGED